MTDLAASTIRQAEIEDAPLLPGIERSAGRAFRSIQGLSWIAGDAVISEDEHRDLIRAGTSWVAEDGEGPLGFLAAQAVPPALHLWEMAVRLDRQGRGLGTRLIEVAESAARGRGLGELTLTTFREVPWNEPFYNRLGFETLTRERAGDRLGAILDREAASGLPAARRCAMRKTL